MWETAETILEEFAADPEVPVIVLGALSERLDVMEPCADDFVHRGLRVLIAALVAR